MEEQDADLEGYVADFAKRSTAAKRRHYARSPKKVGDVVAKLFQQRGYATQATQQQWTEIWDEVVGKPLSDVSRPGALRRGTLQVFTTNSIVSQELTFQQANILAELTQRLPEAKIKKLRFVVAGGM